MTPTEREHEIVDRMQSLSRLREELVVARKNLRTELNKVSSSARNNYYSDPPDEDAWMSAAEIRVLFYRVEGLKSEMKELISELDEFGVNGKLFQVETY